MANYSHLRFDGITKKAELALELQHDYDDLVGMMKRYPVELGGSNSSHYGRWRFVISSKDELDYIINTLLGLPHIPQEKKKEVKPSFITSEDYEKIVKVLENCNVPLDTILEIEGYFAKGKEYFELIPELREASKSIEVRMKKAAKEEILNSIKRMG